MTKRTGRPPLDPDDPSVEGLRSLPSKRYDALYRAGAAAGTRVCRSHPARPRRADVRDSLKFRDRRPSR